MNFVKGTVCAAALVVGAGAAQASTFDIIVSYLPSGVIVDSDGDGDPSTGAQNPTEEFSARQKELFGAAEKFWETVLTGFTGMVNATFTLDAWMTSEDGPDGSLAFAGPTSFETQSGFDRATGGFMQFDADDFGASAPFPQTEQLFLDSAVHEVGHALGFGTQFDFNGLLDASGDNYIGANGLSVYNALYGTSMTSIMLEAGGGHWNECWVQILTDPSCAAADGSGTPGLFNDTELMTPYAVDIPATISPVTIAAFQDLGYLTIDPYTSLTLPLASDVGTSPVPLPAGGLLLGSAIGLGALARRKRRAA